MGASRPDISLRYIFRVQPDPTRLEPQVSTALGNLSIVDPMVLLLEFMIGRIDDAEQFLRILEGEIRYEIAGRMIPAARLRLMIELPVTDEHVPETSPPEIIQAMSRLTLYRMQEQVRNELEAGEYEAATRRLRHLATHVLAAGEHELGSTILSEAARLENGARRTRTLRKSIMYGTKSLIPVDISQTIQGRKP
jgi:Ca-activated chloride channel family protein